MAAVFGLAVRRARESESKCIGLSLADKSAGMPADIITPVVVIVGAGRCGLTVFGVSHMTNGHTPRPSIVFCPPSTLMRSPLPTVGCCSEVKGLRCTACLMRKRIFARVCHKQIAMRLIIGLGIGVMLQVVAS